MNPGLLQSCSPPKSLSSGSRRGERSLQLIGELAARFGEIGATLARDQSHDNIVENGEHLGRVAHAQLRVIFAQGAIPPIVQAILDAPLPEHQPQ